MFNESLFFIFVTLSLPIFAFVLDMNDSIKRAKKRGKRGSYAE